MMTKLFTYTFRTRGWPVWARYLATAAAVALILAVRIRFDAILFNYPFLLFFLPIIVSAVIFDRGSGLFAVGLSAAAAAYFLLPPLHSFRIAETQQIVGWALFVLIGLATAGLIEALHTTVHQLTRAHERLTASEAEKDLLLREASHRMKNDLTVLTALVRLQERAVHDEAARSALAATSDRINVLARLHERLRRSDTDSVVDTREYIGALCEDLRGSLLGARPVAVTLDVEAHPLPQQSAGAVGLVINELVTNALKYAFPNEHSGTITIRFAREGGTFVLQVLDDGVGLPAGGLRRAPGSGLGQRLIRSMVAQLGGAYEIVPGEPRGVRATVRFPATAR